MSAHGLKESTHYTLTVLVDSTDDDLSVNDTVGVNIDVTTLPARGHHLRHQSCCYASLRVYL